MKHVVSEAVFEAVYLLILASAPKRDALYGMKSDFVKGQLQLLGLFRRA
jgi:hypothetical protein